VIGAPLLQPNVTTCYASRNFTAVEIQGTEGGIQQITYREQNATLTSRFQDIIVINSRILKEAENKSVKNMTAYYIFSSMKCISLDYLVLTLAAILLL
jgi:hypothetical protein